MQKAFYEIELPRKPTYSVTVKAEPESDTADCGVDDCTFAGNDDGVYQCAVCGQWFCFVHINMLKSDECDSCKKLPPGIQKEVADFREALNT